MSKDRIIFQIFDKLKQPKIWEEINSTIMITLSDIDYLVRDILLGLDDYKENNYQPPIARQLLINKIKIFLELYNIKVLE